MVLFTQHPELSPALATAFREKHEALFEDATLLTENNGQVVKSVLLNDQEFIIKRYPEKGPRATFRSFAGISRAMNSFTKSPQLIALGIQTPTHLFVARHLGLFSGTTYLIMQKSSGESLYPMIINDPPKEISSTFIANLAKLTHRIHDAGFTHGDLHAGNIFVLPDHSVELIDLDNLRPNLKRQQRDRDRLLRSFDPLPELQAELSQALSNRPD